MFGIVSKFLATAIAPSLELLLSATRQVSCWAVVLYSLAASEAVELSSAVPVSLDFRCCHLHCIMLAIIETCYELDLLLWNGLDAFSFVRS